MERQAETGQGTETEDVVSTPDLAITAMTVVSVANTGAILLGLRTVARQLRIAAPPKEPQPAGTPAGGTP